MVGDQSAGRRQQLRDIVHVAFLGAHERPRSAPAPRRRRQKDERIAAGDVHEGTPGFARRTLHTPNAAARWPGRHSRAGDPSPSREGPSDASVRGCRAGSVLLRPHNPLPSCRSASRSPSSSTSATAASDLRAASAAGAAASPARPPRPSARPTSAPRAPAHSRNTGSPPPRSAAPRAAPPAHGPGAAEIERRPLGAPLRPRAASSARPAAPPCRRASAQSPPSA